MLDRNFCHGHGQNGVKSGSLHPLAMSLRSHVLRKYIGKDPISISEGENKSFRPMRTWYLFEGNSGTNSTPESE